MVFIESDKSNSFSPPFAQENMMGLFDETVDELGLYKIIQKKKGYRFSEDSIQLAEFVLPLKSTDSVIDLGTGSGVIPLILAQKSPVQNIVGIEIQEGLAEIAKRNVKLNNLSPRIKIIKGDFRILGTDFVRSSIFSQSVPTKLETGQFSVVISNPPYTKPVAGRISPQSERAMARMEFTCSLDNLIKVSKYLLAENGRACYSFPILRLNEMLSVVEDNQLKLSKLEFIRPRLGCNVKRFLIEVIKEG